MTGFLLEDAWNALYRKDLVREPWDGLDSGAKADAAIVLGTMLMTYESGATWPGVER